MTVLTKSPENRHIARSAVPVLVLVSGMAGLGYQVIWIRMLTIGLGHEALALLSVITAFFAGLALGGLLVDRIAARLARPGRVYAGLELLIGLWAVALIWLIPAANNLFNLAMGAEPSGFRQALVSLMGPLVLLAPATVAMGATLPLAERLHARRTENAQSVGLLYGLNALGAAAGAYLTLSMISPMFGFSATLGVFALLNLACAALAFRLDPDDVPDALPNAPADVRAVPLMALTGLLGIAFEVVVIRGLAQTVENTIYSFAAIVSCYLLGTAAGSVAWQMYGRRIQRPTLLALLGVCVLLGTGTLAFSADIYHALSGSIPRQPAEALTIAVIFLPSAIAMGALFAHLASAAHGSEGGLGRALAANLIGGAVAPWAVALGLIPFFGSIDTGLLIGVAYLVLAGWMAAGMAPLVAAFTSVSVFWAPLPKALVTPLPDESLLAHFEAGYSAASVLQSPDGTHRLVVDGHFAMGGDSTEKVDRLQGHLPLLMHEGPDRALFLGLGSGATAAAAAAYPTLRADVLELSPPVIALLEYFDGPAKDLATPNIRLLSGDARRFVRATDQRYDVIIADTFHPARDGAALLYTVEHFHMIRARLAPEGLFAQWIPLHQFDLAMLKSVTRSFMQVFPQAELHMANANLGTPLIALVGRTGDRPTPMALAGRVRDAELGRRLATLGIDSSFALMGGALAGPDALERFAAGAPLNTDDRPHVLFAAPRSVYDSLDAAADRLLSLLQLDRTPTALLAVGPRRADPIFLEKLAAYWAARDAFIRLGAETELTGAAVEDANRLVPPLLQIVTASPDYTPAIRPLISLARAIGPIDPKASRALLERVAQITRHPEVIAALERPLR